MMKLAIFVLLFSSAAFADCICQCVNGEVQSICSSSIDLPPICAPRVCPIVPPAVHPIDPPVIPPIGTNKCESKQVWNQYTEQHEWRLICEKEPDGTE